MSRMSVKGKYSKIDHNNDEYSSKKQMRGSKKIYQRKVPSKWLCDPQFSPWLSQSKKNENKAFCNSCDCELTGSIVAIDRHSKTNKHLKNFKEEDDGLNNQEIHSDENFFPSEVTNEVYGSHSVGSPKRIHISYLDHETSTPKVRKFGIINTDKQQPIVSNISNETSSSFKPYTSDSQVIIVKNSCENLTSNFPNEDSSDHLVPLVHNITNTFRNDLQNFLRKNDSVVEYIQDNPEFSEGDAGISRLTRMLVSQMAHQYLMDYTVESWNSRTNPNNSNFLTSKLSEIEKTMEHSVQEMKTIKAEFNAPKLHILNQSEILLGNLTSI